MTYVVRKLQCWLLEKIFPGCSDLPREIPVRTAWEDRRGKEEKRERKREAHRETDTTRDQGPSLITSEQRHWRPPRRHSGPRT